MQYENLTIRRTGAITTVTINRPGKANALNYATLFELEQVALGFRDDIETRAVIFTGNGKHFSAGFDLTDTNEDYDGPLVLRRRRNRIGARAISALHDIDQITIAAWVARRWVVAPASPRRSISGSVRRIASWLIPKSISA